MTKSKLRSRRPSPSLVISILALFVALGGSAYAASKVGTKDIKKNAVTAIKIKKNAVTTAKIKGNAVTGAKVDEGTLGPGSQCAPRRQCNQRRQCGQRGELQTLRDDRVGDEKPQSR